MEITQNVSQLPARPPVDGEFGPVPAIDQISVGDFVAIFSRGAVRVAQVEKIGRTNLTCIYTTKGAWDQAAKIYAIYAPTSSITREDVDSKQAAKNYDFFVQEANPDTAVYATTKAYKTQEQVDADQAKYRALTSVSKEEYVAEDRRRRVAQAQANHDQAIAGGVEQYVHVTTKNVKLVDVHGWRAA